MCDDSRDRDPNSPDRIDFAVTPDYVVVAKFWRIGGRMVAPEESTVYEADFDLAGALEWCERNGYTVRRHSGGARAWKGALEPVRDTVQIRAARARGEREADWEYRQGKRDGNRLGSDFAYDG